MGCRQMCAIASFNLASLSITIEKEISSSLYNVLDSKVQLKLIKLSAYCYGIHDSDWFWTLYAFLAHLGHFI